MKHFPTQQLRHCPYQHLKHYHQQQLRHYPYQQPSPISINNNRLQLLKTLSPSTSKTPSTPSPCIRQRYEVSCNITPSVTSRSISDLRPPDATCLKHFFPKFSNCGQYFLLRRDASFAVSIHLKGQCTCAC